MSITRENIRKISHLARIKIRNSEFEEIYSGLNNILGFIEQLKQMDCSQVDGSVQYAADLHERDDVAIPCDPAVLDNASQKECNMFVVPKVIG